VHHQCGKRLPYNLAQEFQCQLTPKLSGPSTDRRAPCFAGGVTGTSGPLKRNVRWQTDVK